MLTTLKAQSFRDHHYRRLQWRKNQGLHSSHKLCHGLLKVHQSSSCWRLERSVRETHHYPRPWAHCVWRLPELGALRADHDKQWRKSLRTLCGWCIQWAGLHRCAIVVLGQYVHPGWLSGRCTILQRDHERLQIHGAQGQMLTSL